jgi:hypothetical protein
VPRVNGAAAIACAGVLWAVIGTLLANPFAADSAAGAVSPELASGAAWMRATALAAGIAVLALAGLWRRFPAPSAGLVEPSGALAGWRQLGLLIVVASAVRALRLDSGLWYDEIVTLVEFVRLTPGELMTSYTSTNNHILFSLLAHFSVGSFGEHAWALRLPAAGLGVASLAALWWMAHELAPAREARLASWLVALSYHHVWFSQNARGYTGIFLFSWLGTALYLRARRSPVGSARGLWLAYAAALALALYTHLSAIFVFFAHGLVYLGDEGWRAWSRRRSAANASASSVSSADSTPKGFDGWPLVGFAFGLLAALQLYAILLPQIAGTFAVQASAKSGSAAVGEWKNPLWTLLEILGSLQLGPASVVAGVVALALATVGFLSIARRNPTHAALMALPTPITLALLLLVNFNLWPRYFLVSLGFASIIAMRGSFAICASLAAPAAAPGWLRSRPRELATAGCVAMVVLSSVMLLQNFRFPKQDYPAARDFVSEHAAPGEPVFAAGLASYAYSKYYAPDLGVLKDAAELDALRAELPVWLIYSFSVHLRSTKPEIWERIEQDFEMVRSFPGTLRDGAIHVLRRAPAASAERSQPGSANMSIAAHEKPETA